MKKISLSGSISVGKTSAANRLMKQLVTGRVYLEDVSNIKSLKKFYEDAEKYGFISRIEFLCEKAETQISSESFQGINFFDRSFAELPLFANVLKRRGAFDPSEFEIYVRAYDLIAKSVPSLDAVVWLRCLPEVSLKRISNRNREFEKGIEIDYLAALDAAYEEWFRNLTGVHKLKIDTSAKNTETVTQEILEFLQ